jgi:hypothetical protein
MGFPTLVVLNPRLAGRSPSALLRQFLACGCDSIFAVFWARSMAGVAIRHYIPESMTGYKRYVAFGRNLPPKVALERECSFYMVEAAGVELITILITRNLLILGTATTAKKASLPDPLYVYCTKILSLLVRQTSHNAQSIPQIRRAELGKNTQPAGHRHAISSLRLLALS